MNDSLFIIPARAGSKGLPGKNTKVLGNKPLIQYSIDFARHFTEDANICITTNDENVLEIAKKTNLNVPFIRPEELSSDIASANDVIKHAINFYKSKKREFNTVVYLQPTSPFRKIDHLHGALSTFNREKCDMVVSVCESHLNPYFSLFEENSDGYLNRSKKMPAGVSRRQDVPKTYMYNGSIYVINANSLMASNLHDMKQIKKYVMDDIYALDIDTPMDWQYAEFLLSKNLITYD